MPKNYVPEGWETVDGHRCWKFSLLSMKDPTKPQNHFRERYWLDLERGAHALRWEWWVNGKLLTQVSQVRLHELEPGIWIPVRCVAETHWKSRGRRDLKDDPVRRITGRSIIVKDSEGNVIDRTKGSETHQIVETVIDPEQVELNVPMENEALALAFPTGTRVDDAVEGKRFFQGSVQPAARGTATPPPTAEGLDELVAKAESQRRTIEATSLERSGWGFWTISLMAVFSALLVVGGILLIQRRGA